MPDASPLIKRINVIAECQKSRLSIWECPPFLFVVMGIVNIITVIFAYLFASRFIEEPELAALIVIAVSGLIFLVGYFLIAGFNRIAEANRMKSEFLNIVSHQLRTPLSVFKWTNELFAREVGDGGPKDKRYVNILNEHTERMIRIVNLLLDVSRIEAGRFVLQRAPVSLEKLTREAVQSLTPYASSSGVTVTFKSEGDYTILGDVERLRMVIQNLVDNAIRYSSQAGVVTITLVRTPENQVEWRIEDRGIGIPKVQQKYIFQKFFRAGNTAEHQQGTGLGLYIAQTIIKELRGEMGFTSEEGRGSTFWFRLPIYK